MATQQEIRDRLGCAIRVGDVITIQDIPILWPNFSGAADQYNADGDRNFNIHLTQEQADSLAAEGWNVKCKLPRETDEEQIERCTLKLTVKFRDRKGELKKNPPQITVIGDKSRNRNMYGEDLVGLLDSAEIVESDLSFVPYFWETATGIGVTAYLRKLYVVIREDELDQKWAEDSDDRG